MLVSVISGGIKSDPSTHSGFGTQLGPLKGLNNSGEVPTRMTLMSLQWKRAKSLLTDKVLHPAATLFQR